MIGTKVKVKIDRPFGSFHPEHKDILYSLNYGYIEGMIAEDGEEQDVYIMGIDYPIKSFEGEVIAVIKRKNDIEDKLVVAKPGIKYTKEEIEVATKFQEKYFDIEIIM